MSQNDNAGSVNVDVMKEKPTPCSETGVNAQKFYRNTSSPTKLSAKLSGNSTQTQARGWANYPTKDSIYSASIHQLSAENPRQVWMHRIYFLFQHTMD